MNQGSLGQKVWRGLAVAVLLVGSGHRAPAPIIEEDDPPGVPSELAGLPAATPSLVPKATGLVLEVPPPTNETDSPTDLPGMPVVAPSVTVEGSPVQLPPSPGSIPALLPPGTISFSPIPAYPQTARITGPSRQRSGKFRITFNEAGEATSVDTVESTGLGVLDHAAIAAFQKWKIVPGLPRSVIVPITFEPLARERTPRPSAPNATNVPHY